MFSPTAKTLQPPKVKVSSMCCLVLSALQHKTAIYALSLVIFTVAWKAAIFQDGYARQCSR